MEARRDASHVYVNGAILAAIRATQYWESIGVATSVSLVGFRLFLETYKIVVGFLNACFEASDSNDKKDVFKCGTKAVDEAQVNFAISLLEASSDADSSTVISPFSVAVALAMLYAGSEGRTHDEIRQLLVQNSSDNALHDYFASFLNDLSIDYELISSSRVYVKRDLKLRARFLEIIQANYGGNLRQVDFSQPKAVAKEINDYVQKQTNSKIRNLVSAGMFSEHSLIIILSAVYFKGKWKNAFVERDTHKKYFHESEDKRRQVEVPKFQLEGEFELSNALYRMGLKDAFTMAIEEEKKRGISPGISDHRKTANLKSEEENEAVIPFLSSTNSADDFALSSNFSKIRRLILV
uniref:Serpin domain-containing protein n=1 Tax=Ascaris lumbricoides TaxID=6252 RepID=A0A9J2PCF9_ASCLU